ncbi:MAG: hypothetical protein EBX38_06820, partial [Actinobacteria bacterium]|nr:hypothetical protein [Actinomycetota bacterium]
SLPWHEAQPLFCDSLRPFAADADKSTAGGPAEVHEANTTATTHVSTAEMTADVWRRRTPRDYRRRTTESPF